MFAFFEKLVDPYPASPARRAPTGLWRFVWHCTGGLRAYIAAMALCSAAVGVLDALLFVLLGRLLDALPLAAAGEFWQHNRQSLLCLALILCASPLLVGLGGLLRWQTVASNLLTRLRWNFHQQMLEQSIGFHQREFAGRLSAKVMQTAMAVREMVFTLADVLVYVAISFATMLVIVAALDYWLLLPFVVYLLLYLAALRHFVPRMTRMAQSQADGRTLLTGRITDAYSNAHTVKLFSHARREASYARVAMQDFMQTLHRQNRLTTASDIILQGLNMMLILGVCAVAFGLWSRQQLGLGGIAAACAMSLRLNSFSHWVLWEMASLLEHIGSVQDGINTLTQENSVPDLPDAPPLRVGHGCVDFQQVGFAYGGAQPVLRQLSLRVAAGEKIGLIGLSGGGKSTLLSLLLRLYDCDSGRIVIDGQDIRCVSQDSLRAQIGMVTQDTSLLHRSVRDNLLYGRPQADEAQMIAAARAAQAHDFIMGLSDASGRCGYDAHVGERGVTLSGGQRQRIAIARALLKDAPILLLDEATSALDSDVEAAIQASLYRLMAGKTVIAIAHRLSTIAAMDRLIVLDRGRIAEQGDHASLLASNGLYARLWAHQSGARRDMAIQDKGSTLSAGAATHP